MNLDKACLKHDMAHDDFNFLAVIKKYYMVKHVILQIIHNVIDINRNLLQWFTNIFEIFFADTAMQNQRLCNELQKTIIRKYKKRQVYSSSSDNIWDADLSGMQLISRYNKRTRFNLCVIHVFSKYALVTSSKDKKSETITKALQKFEKESNCKRSNIWTGKDNEFYNRSIK